MTKNDKIPENSIGNQLGEQKFWSADVVCSVAEALQPDDEIVPGPYRERPLRVVGFEEQRCDGFVKATDYPYRIWWLEGNGTRYRLRWSHNRRTVPHLHTESELETRERYCHRRQEHITKTTAKVGTGETVRRISVGGVDDNDLPEWVLSRQVDVVRDDERLEDNND